MTAGTLISWSDGAPLHVVRDGEILSVLDDKRGELARWSLCASAGGLSLAAVDPRAPIATGQETSATAASLALLEAAFAFYPRLPSLWLTAGRAQLDILRRLGVAIEAGEGRARVDAGLLWQQSRLWLADREAHIYPLDYVSTGDRRHPRRPPKPNGVVYRRHIPWLDGTLSFRAIDRERDLERFHRWMNDPAVAEFWGENGEIDAHRAYLDRLAADPHMIPLIASIDDEPFAYFEIYWAKENRLAPFYDADDYDRGWHVLVGEPAFRGRRYVTAWLPSLVHYLFLDDPRTKRIVGEPRADHVKQIRNLHRCGFAKLEEFDFPHKRALLVMLSRERFFGERLWVPQTDDADDG